MLKFSSFIKEQVQLDESLTSAVEFYMTDDTEMPKRIYGAFELDEQKYGISLEESIYPKIYTLKLYKIVSSKGRLWTFHKPSHIVPALSTAIKFVESCMPFLTGKFDGVIMPYGKKVASGRFKKIAERMIKKLYIKSFRYVPVEGSGPEKAVYDYVFIINKLKKPEQVFSSKTFKGYAFDGEIPLDMAVSIIPKRIPKPTVSVDPSEKYSFNGLNVALVEPKEADKELLKKVLTMPKGVVKDKEDDDLAKSLDKALEGLALVGKDNPKLENDVDYVFAKQNLEAVGTNLFTQLRFYVLGAGVSAVFEKMKELKYSDFNLEDFNIQTLKTSLDVAYANNPAFRAYADYKNFKKDDGKWDWDKISYLFFSLDDMINTKGEDYTYKLIGNVEKIMNVYNEQHKKVEKIKSDYGVGSEEDAAALKLKEKQKELESHEGSLFFGVKGSATLAAAMPSMASKIKQYGYDQSKVDGANLKYAFNQAVDSNPAFKTVANELGLVDNDGNVKMIIFNQWMIEMGDDYAKNPEEFEKLITKASDNLDKYNTLKKEIEQLGGKKEDKPKSSSYSNKKVPTIKGSIDPAIFTTNVPGAISPTIQENGEFNEYPNDHVQYQIEEHFYYKLGYEKIFSKLANKTEKWAMIKAYTGNSYDAFNDTLRNYGKSIIENNADEYSIQKFIEGIKETSVYHHTLSNAAEGAILKLYQVQQEIEPLEEGIWVYRNCTIPSSQKEQIEPGFDLVDPAFLSTSINPSISLGKNPPTSSKLAIYLPAGSKVIPIFSKSSHPSEGEIILPPFSINKILQIDTSTEYSPDKYYSIQCVYTGTAMEDIVDKIEKTTKMQEALMQVWRYENIMNEAKKNNSKKETSEKEYDGNNKFGGPIHLDTKNIFTKLLNKGKVVPPKQKK